MPSGQETGLACSTAAMTHMGPVASSVFNFNDAVLVKCAESIVDLIFILIIINDHCHLRHCQHQQLNLLTSRMCRISRLTAQVQWQSTLQANKAEALGPTVASMKFSAA